jgi:hypothetical protein
MLNQKIALGLAAILGLMAILIAGCGQAAPVPATQAALTISTASLADGQVGIIYSQTLKAAGGKGNYTWSLAGGSLPGRFALLANTGSINGTPDKDGTFSFTVQVSDGTSTATRDFSITIKPSGVPLVIGTTSLANGEVGIGYSRTLSASGGIGTYSWSISSGSLPDGMTIDQVTGLISGTPKSAGIFSFSVQVMDGTGARRDQSYNLNIRPVPVISTSSLPDGQVGTDYDQILEAAGGTGSYMWSASGGSIPDGLILDPGYGEIYGTPVTAGTFNFTVQAKDSAGGVASRDLSITIKAK